MRSITVSVAEGKKNFSRLISNTLKKREDIVVTKRGKPVAVIISFEEYKMSKQIEGYWQIMEARAEFAKAGIRAEDIIKESKKQLEKRPWINL